MAKKRKQAAAGIAARTNSTAGAGDGEGRKKRKAAEASCEKTKRIVYDESDDENDLAGDLPELPASDMRVTRVEVKGQEDKVEDMPLVVPGLRLWEAFADTVPGTEVGKLAKLNSGAKKDGEGFDLSRKYGFSFQPLIVTEGPLAGEQVLVLKRTATFRFLDLPPEIRNLIYEHALAESNDEIRIRSYNPRKKSARRPVRWGFKPGTETSRYGLTWDTKTSKWIGDVASPQALLRVCRQIFKETAPIVYGKNCFTFWDLGDADLFLERIGSMRRFVRHVKNSTDGYRATHIRSVFKQLEDASDLRSIRFYHTTLCPDTYNWYRGTTPELMAQLAAPLLYAVARKAVKQNRELSVDVRDIIRVLQTPEEHTECYQCGAGREDKCNHWGGCRVKCADRGAHREELQQRVRSAVAKALKMHD